MTPTPSLVATSEALGEKELRERKTTMGPRHVLLLLGATSIAIAQNSSTLVNHFYFVWKKQKTLIVHVLGFCRILTQQKI